MVGKIRSAPIERDPALGIRGPDVVGARADQAVVRELLEDVRRRPATRALPVVILTTRAGEKHQSLARRLGVNHYITKPVAEEPFVRLVESLVTGGRERTS